MVRWSFQIMLIFQYKMSESEYCRLAHYNCKNTSLQGEAAMFSAANVMDLWGRIATEDTGNYYSPKDWVLCSSSTNSVYIVEKRLRAVLVLCTSDVLNKCIKRMTLRIYWLGNIMNTWTGWHYECKENHALFCISNAYFYE